MQVKWRCKRDLWMLLYVFLCVFLCMWFFSTAVLLASDEHHTEDLSWLFVDPELGVSGSHKEELSELAVISLLPASVVVHFNPPFRNALPSRMLSVFKGMNRYWNYAFAVIAAAGYVFSKKNSLSSSVWLSEVERDESLANFSSKMNEDLSRGSSEQPPNMVPIVPSSQEDDASTSFLEEKQKLVEIKTLASFETPKQRLSLAVSVALASMSPYISNIQSTTYGSTNDDFHKSFFAELLKMHAQMKNWEVSLYGVSTIHKAIPEEVGLIYHSPYTFALVEAFSIMQVLAYGLSLLPKDTFSIAGVWINSSYGERAAFLNKVYEGENYQEFVSATDILKLSVHLDHVGWRVMALPSFEKFVDNDHKKSEDVKERVERHIFSVRALVSSMPFTGYPHWKSFDKELEEVKKFQLELMDAIYRQYSPSSFGGGFGDSQRGRSTKNKKSKKMLSNINNFLSEVMDFERARFDLFSNSYPYLRYIKYAVLDMKAAGNPKPQ